jgi:hypothetical protein
VAIYNVLGEMRKFNLGCTEDFDVQEIMQNNASLLYSIIHTHIYKKFAKFKENSLVAIFLSTLYY